MRSSRILIALAALAILAIVAAVLAMNPGGNTANSGTDLSSLNRVDFIGPNGTTTTVVVEVADTPQEQEQGLMYRTSLDEDRGMLFVFSGEYPLQFWMKNTRIPLDIVFINSSYRIVDIDRNATPYSEDVYTSRAPSEYVVEVNGRFCERHGIAVGDRIKISLNSTTRQ